MGETAAGYDRFPHRDLLSLHLAAQLLVPTRQLVELDQVAGTPLQLTPDGDLLPVLGRLPGQPARVRGVVPNPWLGQPGL